MTKKRIPNEDSGPNSSNEDCRCGFVALVGTSNVGKSTLLNALVGSKLAIVTPKVQTTRTRIVGITIRESAQLIFVDTPGIFVPRRPLDRAMVSTAWSEARSSDVVVQLIDSSRADSNKAKDETKRVIDGLRDAGRQVVLVLNKVDLVAKPKLLELTDRLRVEEIYCKIFMISALKGSGLDDLVAYLANRVPTGPWLYPEDQIGDIPLRLLASEITREQIYLRLHKELPYATTVETESWEEWANGSVRIEQVIYVQRPSQKAIVLGKGGRQIKEIGVIARSELKVILDRTVHLFLFVKVREHWPTDPERYRGIGLEYLG